MTQCCLPHAQRSALALSLCLLTAEFFVSVFNLLLATHPELMHIAITHTRTHTHTCKCDILKFINLYFLVLAIFINDRLAFCEWVFVFCVPIFYEFRSFHFNFCICSSTIGAVRVFRHRKKIFCYYFSWIFHSAI